MAKEFSARGGTNMSGRVSAGVSSGGSMMSLSSSMGVGNGHSNQNPPSSVGACVDSGGTAYVVGLFGESKCYYKDDGRGGRYQYDMKGDLLGHEGTPYEYGD